MWEGTGMRDKRFVNEGEIVLLSEGSYSDYRAGPIFRALERFNMEETVKEHMDEKITKSKDVRSPYTRACYGASAFCTWLERKGLVEEVEYFEWWEPG